MKTANIVRLLGVLLLVLLTACSRKSDEERILKDIDSTSVHLIQGLKILVANPNNDPQITALQNTINEILESPPGPDGQSELTLSEIGRLAKVTYRIKKLGKAEVALGKKTDFRFLRHIGDEKKTTGEAELTVEQDHAMTLGMMYIFELQASAGVTFGKKNFLYEAWMAGDARFNHVFLDGLLRAAQVSTFAKNDYCDFAWQKSELLRQTKLEKLNVDYIISSIRGMTGLERVNTHDPKSSEVLLALVFMPAIIEIMPRASKIMAHVEVAGCFERLDKPEKVLKQYEYTIEALEEMGIPEEELAIFRAAISYKKEDFENTKKHLKNAAKSRLLDERSKKDLLELAENIQSADDSMIQKYFSSVNLSLTVGKIIHQRLKDEGVYKDIANIKQIKKMEQMLNSLRAVSAGDVLNKGKDLFDKFK